MADSLLTPAEQAKRERWLLERKTGLGGSDAAAAVGADPYRDRLTLWSEKVGLTEGDDLSENEAVEAGIVLERTIGEWYGKKFDRSVSLGEPFTIRRSKEYPWMFATLDATQVIDGQTGVVQIKNTSFAAEQWEERLPVHYEIQLAHEMIVAGVTRGTLVALHRGQNLRAYDRTLHPEFASALIDAERSFWELVTIEKAPEPGAASAEAVKAMFPKVEIEDLVALPPGADDLDMELEELKQMIGEMEDRRSAIESMLKMWIGKHAGGVTPQGTKFSWKGSTVNYKPQEARSAYVRRFTRSKAR